MKLASLTGLLLASVSAGAIAQPVPSGTHSAAKSTAAAEAATPGLAIGQQAPNFELSDQHRQQQSLSGLLEAGPVALVFYRSADS